MILTANRGIGISVDPKSNRETSLPSLGPPFHVPDPIILLCDSHHRTGCGDDVKKGFGSRRTAIRNLVTGLPLSIFVMRNLHG